MSKSFILRALSQLLLLIGLGFIFGPAEVCAATWTRGESEHFTIYSAGSKGESREVLEKLEQFREVVLKTTKIGRGHDRRIDVFLFGSSSQMEPYAPLYQGKPKAIGGLFMNRPDRDTIMLHAGQDIDRSVSVVYHEYMHAIVRARGINLPPWLNEGLAELYETTVINRDEVELGRGNPYHVMTLRKMEPLPLARLFAIKADSSEYNEGQRRTTFYAQSWALVHMIYRGDGANLKSKLADFMGRLERQTNPNYEQIFEEAFEMPISKMQQMLYDYVRSGSYTYSIIKSEVLGLPRLPKDFSFERLPDWERDLMLTVLRARVHRSADTMLRLMQLADRAPQDPRPYEYLGVFQRMEGEDQQALSHWKRAIELGSTDTYVALQLLDEVLVPVGQSVTLRYRMPDEMNETLRGYAERAVKAEPFYVEAWEALAQVEAYANSPRPDAVKQIEDNVGNLRYQGKVWLMLAVLHWRLGNVEACEKALVTSTQWPRRPTRSYTYAPTMGIKGPDGRTMRMMTPAVNMKSPIGKMHSSGGSVYSLVKQLKTELELVKKKAAEAAEPKLELHDLDIAPAKK